MSTLTIRDLLPPMPMRESFLDEPIPFALGCILPRRTYNIGNFHFVELADGRTKVMARLSAHYDAAYDTNPPPDTDWWAKASPAVKRMYLNDSEGCCTISDAYHRVGLWTANDGGNCVVGTDAEVQQMYNAYKAGSGDSGCIPTDVLDHLKTKGLLVNGQWHLIDDYVALDWTNQNLTMAALEVFGSIDLALDLPSAWANAKDIWDVTNTRSVGGHSVPGGGATAKDGVRISTWGGLRTITWPAFTSKKWISEAYVPLSPDWYGKDGLAPNGFNVETLRADLQLIRDGKIPSVITPDTRIDWFV